MSRFHRPLFLASLLATLAIGSGCAFTTDRIDLDYSAMSSPQPIPGAENIRLRVQVVDKRAVKERIGNKVNGFGSEMAPIVSDTDVAKYFESAVRKELEVRGYRMEEGTVDIRFDLLKFFNRFNTGFWAGGSTGEIEFYAIVNDAQGRPLYNELIRGSFKHSIQLANGTNAKEALEGAMQDAMKQLFTRATFFDAIRTAAETPAVSPAVPPETPAVSPDSPAVPPEAPTPALP